MGKIQENVKSAVSSTTSALKGFNGTFSLYTTTKSLNQNGVDENGKPILVDPYTGSVIPDSRNRDEINFYKIANDEGVLVPSLSFTDSDLNDYKSEENDDGAPIYSSYEYATRYTNYSPYRSIAFSSGINAEQFSNFQNEVSSEINKVDVSGSSTEVGLCSLLRNIDTHRDSSGFHTYIIATNEDDRTDEENCVREVVRRWERRSNTVTGGAQACDDSDPDCSFNYTVSYQRQRKSRLEYRYSYADSERIEFSLNDSAADNFNQASSGAERASYSLNSNRLKTIRV